MSRKRRIQKPVEVRVRDCEAHLHFLRDARRLFEHEPDRYKQIAAELRVLVGDHSPKKRLLFSLMSEFGFAYEVQPPGPPNHQMPIPLKGEARDLPAEALVAKLEAAKGDESVIQELLKVQEARRHPVDFADYVDNGLAVFIAPHEYSFRELVVSVAQQEGSAHEDTAVDESLVHMGQIVIGRDPAHIAALVKFADLVLAVGAEFIKFLSAKYGYEPRYFIKKFS